MQPLISPFPPLQPPDAAAVASVAAPPQTSQRAATLEQGTPSTQAVEDAARKLSTFVAATHPEISFSVDRTSGIQVVRVTDSATHELIRQIPSEEAVHLAEALDKLQGLLLSTNA